MRPATVLTTVEEYLAQAVTLVATPHTSLPAPRAALRHREHAHHEPDLRHGRRRRRGNRSVHDLRADHRDQRPGARTDGYAERRLGYARQPFRRAPRASGHDSTRRHELPARPEHRARRAPGRDRGLDRGSRACGAGPGRREQRIGGNGRTLFGQVGLVVPGFSCATCHGGPKWTRSTVDYTAPPSPEIGLGLGNERVIGAELRQTLSSGAAMC